MVGTIANVAGILIGGLIGYVRGAKPVGGEAFLKIALGAFTIYYGLRLSWISIGGPLSHILKQMLIAIVALSIGKLVGRMMRLQRLSNRIGARARERMTASVTHGRPDPVGGFKTCAALFCATPLAMLGSIQEGLSNYYYPLVVKAFIEGLGALGFVAVFRWGALLAALPVLVFQGTLSLACSQWLAPVLESHHLEHLVDELNLVGGLLVFCVGLIIFELKKIEVADYLPALIFAPLIAWIW